MRGWDQSDSFGTWMPRPKRGNLPPMLHISLHFVVPVLVALAFYRSRWQQAALILIATILVDLDHLLADPIYDPERCSIGYHPLHTLPAIVLYAVLFLLPLLFTKKENAESRRPAALKLHLIGLGLLIHMALDWIDCLI